MIKKKIDKWYKKPRKTDGFVMWILTNPKALGITMTMGYIVACALFLTLSIMSFIWQWGWFTKTLMILAFALTIRNLYKFYKFNKLSHVAYHPENWHRLKYL